MGRGRNGANRRGRVSSARTLNYAQPRFNSGDQFVMNSGARVLPLGQYEKVTLGERTLATVNRVSIDTPERIGYFVDYQRNNRFERGFVYETDLT